MDKQPWELEDKELIKKEMHDFFNPVGRPPKFRTAAEMGVAFRAYLRWTSVTYYNKHELVKGGELAGQIYAVKHARRPLTISGFCVFCNASMVWYRTFRSNNIDDPEFLALFELIEETCKDNQISGAMTGEYRENIVSRLNGITERVDLTTNGMDIKNESGYDLSKYTEDELRTLAELQLKGRAKP